MGRRRLVRSTEAATLLGIAADEDSLIRHFTLDPADRLECELRRRPQNKLGFAVQLCTMRQTGRLLWDREQPPVAVINYLADQLGIDARLYDLYARRVQTRFDHSRHLMDYLGLRTASKQDRRAALVAAIEAATNGDSGLPIAAAIVARFRKRNALLPSLHSIEKIGLGGRAIARRRAEKELIEGIPSDRLASLDGLLEVDPSIGQTRFHWLRSAPEAPGASNLVGLTERIAFLRTLGIDPKLRVRMSSGRWDQMIREGNATPAWLANDFTASRRHALIVAQVIKLGQKLTDDAVSMFIKLMGRLFSKANNRKKQRHMDCRPETAKALRMFLDTITALQSANDYGRNALEVLDQKVGWHRILRMKPELESMVEDNEASPLTLAGEQYATVSKYVGAFLQAFTFQSARRHDPLLAAISMLKRLYAEKRRTLPDRVPVTHLSQTDRKLIFGEKPDRRLYEIATLVVLRNRLRSADIWVEGSRSFRPIDEHLMPRSTFTRMKEEDRLGLGVHGDGAQWLAEVRQMLDFNLKRLAHRARSGKLEGVRLEAGTLTVTPNAGEVPAAAEELNAEISDMYPMVEVPDLLREVHEWTGFADCFTHVRTGDVPRNVSAMLAGVLADATNLGPRRMASASKGISAHQIGWMRTFHARSETYRAAQACVTDVHTRHPHSRLWGNGTTASSDGQFFRASDRAAKRGDINLHYGSEPGSKFYSHLSDQYGYFSILPISPTESEAAYVLDGLFDQDTVLDIQEHFTDTGGASDHVFGLFALIGKRFAPRLRNLKDRKFHTFEKGAAYPALSNHIGAPINAALILDHWDDLLHLAASITTRSVVPSTILKKLSASPKESQLARALRELGRIERSLFMIEWYSSPALRRRCQAGLNKGEAAHKLKRAVFFHERGEIRDRSFESQAFRASGLNLVVSAIVHWNTVYIERAVTHLRKARHDIPDHLLKHVSPLSWEHINLTGIYTWDAEHQMPEGFRSLRLPARLRRAA
ncbi:Tn3 family transposase [Aquamicrobium defluvii]|uniref:Transposase n=1 Tax=Aquamicrobium defluvii TaxID=69279 RepID=A0A011TUT1_9HYPH|nr:Tn3 family transposase [Aquamicrobium defluvii]EXL07897.1 transposase [Aquamicrobium defluvii]EZQ14930.1 transposase [Halopseudomonas bauzanensis]